MSKIITLNQVTEDKNPIMKKTYEKRFGKKGKGLPRMNRNRNEIVMLITKINEILPLLSARKSLKMQ